MPLTLFLLSGTWLTRLRLRLCVLRCLHSSSVVPSNSLGCSLCIVLEEAILSLSSEVGAPECGVALDDSDTICSCILVFHWFRLNSSGSSLSFRNSYESTYSKYMLFPAFGGSTCSKPGGILHRSIGSCSFLL
ncbi:hypothetical protein Avbf_16568, partial [Armadillidium vulgare]